MASVSQDFFNEYREAKIIEVLQKVAKSPAGPLLAFKGGTALRLFWDLPRYSQDVDFTLLRENLRDEVYREIHQIAEVSRYEITDAVKKRRTVLFEFRFQWEGPNFHLKVEVSSPLPEDRQAGEIPVRTASLRGVPVLVLREERLTAQKLCALYEREAPRDVYDFSFILRRRLKVDWPYVLARTGLKAKEEFFQKIQQKIQRFPKRKLVTDVGKLVSAEEREWLKKNFLEDVDRLIGAAARETSF